MLNYLGQGQAEVLLTRHHDDLTRNPVTSRGSCACCKAKIKISLYTGGGLDLSTASGGFYGFMETGRAWYESAIRSQRVKDAVERNARAGKRTGGGSRPFGYKIICHDLGEGGRRRYRIFGEEIEPAEARRSRRPLAEWVVKEAVDGQRRDVSNSRIARWRAGSTWLRMLCRQVASDRTAALAQNSRGVSAP